MPHGKSYFNQDTAAVLLISADLECVGDNLRCVVENDNPNAIYNIPNYCIANPIFERDFIQLEKNGENVLEKPLEVKCEII